MKKSLFLALCAAAVMAACGGGGDDGEAPAQAEAPTTAVPPSASMTVTGLVTYLSALIGASADTLEPVDVSVVTPVADETIEPSSVD